MPGDDNEIRNAINLRTNGTLSLVIIVAARVPRIFRFMIIHPIRMYGRRINKRNRGASCGLCITCRREDMNFREIRNVLELWLSSRAGAKEGGAGLRNSVIARSQVR